MVSSLADEWIEAARDLGIRVVTSFVLSHDEISHHFDVLLPDFGGINGMVLMETFTDEKANAAMALGYGFSCLSGGRYHRESAIECLRDWTWTGDAERPNWL
jgi:hypothetical protein